MSPRWPRPRRLSPNKELRYLKIEASKNWGFQHSRPTRTLRFVTFFHWNLCVFHIGRCRIRKTNHFSPLNSFRSISLLCSETGHLEWKVLKMNCPTWHSNIISSPQCLTTCHMGSWMRESNMLMSVSVCPSQKLKSRVALYTWHRMIIWPDDMCGQRQGCNLVIIWWWHQYKYKY